MFADDFLTAFAGEWMHVECISIRDAACLLTYSDPHKYRGNEVLSSESQTMLAALQSAIMTGKLAVFAVWSWEEGECAPSPIQTKDVTPHTYIADTTTVMVAELEKWCDSHGLPHIWQNHFSETSHHSSDYLRYPEELRAAIEAFEAIKGDPTATAGRTPKAALLRWLVSNKPELSGHARQRVASVANWLPAGGAPKTPGD